MNKLRTCPFCGGEQAIKTRYIGYGSLGLGSHDEYRVVCKECRASSDEYKSEAKAIAAWNRRAKPENKPLALDELRQMDGEPIYVIVLDKMAFADKDDAINGWGLCRKSWVRLWDGARADIIHIDHDFEDYGKIWLAYRSKPKGEHHEDD